MTAAPKILILKTGSTAPAVIRHFGDFDRWFLDALAGQELRFEVRDVTHAAPGELGDCAGCIVTGSPASVCDPPGWIEPLAAFLRRAGDSGRPLLGVCFGAQALAHAYGGRVVRNPRGWEIGGIGMRLTREALEDPLFDGLDQNPWALATHEDHIESLPAGATLLGSNECAIQAFRVRPSVWGVQFHPEITPRILEILIRVRGPILEADAASRQQPVEGLVDRLLASLGDPRVAEGGRLMANFARLCR